MGACPQKTGARESLSFPQQTKRLQQPPASRAFLRIPAIIEKTDLRDSKLPLYLRKFTEYVSLLHPLHPPSLEASANLNLKGERI